MGFPDEWWDSRIFRNEMESLGFRFLQSGECFQNDLGHYVAGREAALLYQVFRRGIRQAQGL